MKLSEIACTAKFAHLLGLHPKRAAQERDEEDTKKLKRAEDEEDEEKEAEDESEDEAAEDEEDKEDAEDESDQEKKSKRAKRARRAKANDEGEDDDKDKDSDEDAEARGRRLERARAQAIFESKAASIRPDIAAQLAFETRLPSREAIALLASIAKSTPRRSASSLDERMATIKSPNVGVEGVEPNGARTLAAQILAAGKKARGER